MTIALKLTKIAEKQQSIYDAGQAKGYDAGYADGQAQGEVRYKEGVADGAVQHFRDHHERCLIQQNYTHAFAGIGWANTSNGWNGATYIPQENMVFDCTVNSSNMYAYSGVSDTVVPINLKNATGNARSTFVNATNLVTIRKLLISETTPNLNFTNCTKLANITVDGIIGKSWNLSSSPLTNETVQHIIEHLADLTGAATQTLTLKSSVGAAMTDAQKATVTAKNWTLVY